MGEEGDGLKKDFIKGDPIDQEWPLSSFFLYLSRLRGKGKGVGMRGHQEVRQKRI